MYHPDVETAPPLATGNTWVKFPTWFWIQEPLSEIFASSDQDLGNIRVTLRATLELVEFTFGEAVIRCAPDELQPFIEGESHPVDDVGPCHHRPLEVADLDVGARLAYRVEQRTSTRDYSTHAWRHGSWQAHPVNLLDIERVVAPFAVRELLALNVID